MLKFIVALIGTLGVTYGQVALEVRCVPDSNVIFNDFGCAGTPDNPCSALIRNFPIGIVDMIKYKQGVLDDLTPCNDNGDPNVMNCDEYWSTIYVRSIGDQIENPSVRVQLSPNAIRAICDEACLNVEGELQGFSGLCQKSDKVMPRSGGGCKNAATLEDDVCTQRLAGLFEVVRTGRCEIGALSPDDHRFCAPWEPCLVKIADKISYGFEPGDLVKVTYHQHLVETGEAENDLCAENAPLPNCENYYQERYAIVEEGYPQWGSFELTPHGVQRFCAAPCLDAPNGTFSGICQRTPLHPDGTECTHEFVPAFGHELCGVPLLGEVEFELFEVSTTSNAHRWTLAVAVVLLVF